MNLLINASEKKKQVITNSIISTKNLKGFKVNSYFNSLKGNKKAYNKYDYAKELKERSQKLQNKISAHNLAFGTIFSENDILYGRKTRDSISLEEQERKDMDYLNKINENDDSYYTLEDLPLFEYLNDDQFRENGGISR